MVCPIPQGGHNCEILYVVCLIMYFGMLIVRLRADHNTYNVLCNVCKRFYCILHIKKTFFLIFISTLFTPWPVSSPVGWYRRRTLKMQDMKTH